MVSSGWYSIIEYDPGRRLETIRDLGLRLEDSLEILEFNVEAECDLGYHGEPKAPRGILNRGRQDRENIEVS